MDHHFARAALAAAAFATIPALAANCKPVTGHFEAGIVPPGAEHCPAVPDVLCTAGRVWGGINGTYRFVVTAVQPAAPLGGIPTAIFFTGQSVVTLHDGRIVDGTDSGTLDGPPAGQGGFASLITFTSGGSGQIRLRGAIDPAAGTTSGDYVGQFCGS